MSDVDLLRTLPVKLLVYRELLQEQFTVSICFAIIDAQRKYSRNKRLLFCFMLKRLPLYVCLCPFQLYVVSCV